MIPKEVTEALKDLAEYAHHYEDLAELGEKTVDKEVNIIKSFLETTDRYVRDLEQHVDDLAAGQHGVMEDD